MVTFSNSVDSTIGASISGATNTLTVQNPSNTASSQALINATVGGSSAGDAFTTYTVSGVTNWSEGVDNSDSDAYVLAASTALGTTNVIHATTSGQINYPLQPAFSAYVSSSVTNATGDGTFYTIIPDTEVFDVGNNYNNSTGTFTAPITGQYAMLFGINIGNVSVAMTDARGFITASNAQWDCFQLNYGVCQGSGNNIGGQFSALVDMDASDVVNLRVWINNGTKTATVRGTSRSDVLNFMTGWLVC